jgi:hypothetical protein
VITLVLDKSEEISSLVAFAVQQGAKFFGSKDALPSRRPELVEGAPQKSLIGRDHRVDVYEKAQLLRVAALLFSVACGKFGHPSGESMKRLLILLLPIFFLGAPFPAQAQGVSFGIPLPFPFLFYNFGPSYNAPPYYGGGYYARPAYYYRRGYYGGYCRPRYYYQPRYYYHGPGW